MKTLLTLITFLAFSSILQAADLLVTWGEPESGEPTGYLVHAKRSSDPSFQLVKTALVADLVANAAGEKGALIPFDQPGLWSVYVIAFFDRVYPDQTVVRIMGPEPRPEDIFTFTVPGRVTNVRVSPQDQSGGN